jgi:signal transduction histidine kinase
MFPLGRQPFNLTRWFSLLSLACIASISAVSALLLSNFLTDKMLQRDSLLSMEFVQAAVLSDKAAAYFLAGQPLGAGKELENTFQRLAHMPDVLRANVYARDRSIVWSSDDNLVGKNFPSNPELDEALHGEVVVNSGIISKEEHLKAGHSFSEEGVKYFIETYVPLWTDGRKEVIGVVELYRTPDALFEAIHDGQRLIWLSAALGGLFLYAALFWIVRHADRIMRKQHERLVETETLAALGEMASAVAHGIRNPLASIRSSAELALEGAANPPRESARDIIAEVDRMEQWVRELLGYSRPVGGGAETVELNSIIRRSLDNFAREMEKRNIDVSAQLGETLPVVRGDLGLLGQVFNSLIVNAVEAMPGNGRLTVSSRLAQDHRHVEVSFSDTGTGIEAGELGKVLKPFHTTKPKGLGLGLPLARRIVERYGGTLAIASTAGAGTAVTLRFIPAA